MKTILTVAIVLMGWMAQAQHPIEYYYDANGSRILRKAVVIKKGCFPNQFGVYPFFQL